ncbi:MAG: hypothetical protein ACOH18_01820 [Candidatus Saccharimonadaceae bacterium]
MSLFMKQTESRSELQDKLAKELQERAKQKAFETERPDGVTDSAYLQDTKEASSLTWVWVLIGVAIIVLVIWLIVSTM